MLFFGLLASTDTIEAVLPSGAGIKLIIRTMIPVKNVAGTSRWSGPLTGESPWLEYWKSHRTGYGTVKCGHCGTSFDLVGAHVKKVQEGDELYITPLCRRCNQKEGSFYVGGELVRVPSGL